MKILKHGEYYGDKKRKRLIGYCDNCHCEFETFVDLFIDGKKITYSPDVECADIVAVPEWTGGDLIPTSQGYIFKKGVMTNMLFSSSCPECGYKVELKMKV